MIILGIDPGLANTGWGVIEQRGAKKRALAYGCVNTMPTEHVLTRLEHIYDEMLKIIERYKPIEVGIESIFFGANAKSALSTGQASGAVMIAAAKSSLSVSEYSPTQIKQVMVGQGRAEKQQVLYMVKAMLGLDHEPSPDHASDALAVALCHAKMRAVLYSR
ncbi:MAG TPA: crossover junction endodeoxyribonuclease RuvC [Coriobacteriia bacterium]|nr:crossover junction endodeoxyribonuclease RuvC [Coriobacteriia bacterium]